MNNFYDINKLKNPKITLSGFIKIGNYIINKNNIIALEYHDKRCYLTYDGEKGKTCVSVTINKTQFCELANLLCMNYIEGE